MSLFFKVIAVAVPRFPSFQAVLAYRREIADCGRLSRKGGRNPSGNLGTWAPPCGRNAEAVLGRANSERSPRSPLVDHADDHVLDQDNVNNIVAPHAPGDRASRLDSCLAKAVLKTGPKAGFQ